MNKQIDIKEALDWYIWAGVDETCSDCPCLISTERSPSQAVEPQKITDKTVQTSANNFSTQSFVSVSKNARELCSQAQNLSQLRDIMLNFEGCSLKNTAASTVFGDGDEHAKVMLIGEAPGADEDRLGKPFVGRCGKLLDKMLAAVGFNRPQCYITNILPWRPPGNRTPTDDEIAVCLPFVKRQIELIEPDFILLLGGISLKSIMDTNDSISRTRGKWFEYSLPTKNINVLATYHPSYLLRSTAQKSKVWVDLLRLKKKFDDFYNK